MIDKFLGNIAPGTYKLCNFIKLKLVQLVILIEVIIQKGKYTPSEASMGNFL